MTGQHPAGAEQSRHSQMRTGMTGVINAYRRYLSPLLGQHCRFYPSCSQYAALAVTRHGVLRGGLLAVKRLLRCHPLHPGGVDLVPESLPRARN